ncbi:MAG: ABC transporter permease [Planctomyces sp.]
MKLSAAFRPYIAILKDSFREALVSRVLWVALFGILMLLLVLAPFGIRTEKSDRLRQHEVTDPEEFLLSILPKKDGEQSPSSTAEDRVTKARQHLWNILSDDQKNRIRSWQQLPAPPENRDAAGGPRRTDSIPRQIVKLINEILPRAEFYDAGVWDDLDLDAETRELIELSRSDESRIQSRNLKLLAAAFPGSIGLQNDPAISLVYGTTELFGPIDTMFSEFRRAVDEVVIGVLTVFLGFFGLFGALLVSASVIPRTWETGEISLLLSKPISRSLLFLTRFLGGCSFTFVCVSFLVVGVWLLLGLRLHFWRIELLWCIPIYVFLFAVYFAVSAVAGVIWRNSIVSLILATLFWIVLFTVGTARSVIEQNVVRTRKITEIIQAGDDFLIVDGSYAVRRWTPDRKQWREVLIQHGQRLPPVVRRVLFAGTKMRPVYDSVSDRILLLQPEPNRFLGGAPTLVSGTSEGSWEREVEGLAPESILAMAIDSESRVILAGRRGVYEFRGQSPEQKKAQKYIGGIFGRLMTSSVKDAFPSRVEGRLPSWTAEAIATMNTTGNALFILDQGVLHRIDRTADGLWKHGPSHDIGIRQPATMISSATSVMIASEDGILNVIDGQSLQSFESIPLPSETRTLSACAASDGSAIAVLTSDGVVQVYDEKSRKTSRWKPKLHGEITAIAFGSDHRLIVADQTRLLHFYRNFGTEDSVPELTIGPPQDWVSFIDHYFLKPIYKVLPKPSELNSVVTYLVTGEEYVSADGSDGSLFNFGGNRNLPQEKIRVNLTRPIVENVLFIAVMLTLGCVYVSRRDF